MLAGVLWGSSLHDFFRVPPLQLDSGDPPEHAGMLGFANRRLVVEIGQMGICVVQMAI